jgi:hypothetical protein
MDTASIAELIRGLRTWPSRRAVATTLVTLGATTALAPLVDQADVRGKGRKKRKGKKKRKKKKLNPECPSGQVLCDDLQCCERDLCTVEGCGCCPATEPQCCGNSSTLTRFCYDSAAETCCPTVAETGATACPQWAFCANSPDDPDSYHCCESSGIACGRGCCPQGTVCCYNDQADDHECCPDETCQWWIAFNCTYAYEHIVYPRTF